MDCTTQRPHTESDALFVGIDMGTTKIAVVLVDDAGRLQAALSQPHEADLQVASGRSEQDAERMIALALDFITALPQQLRTRVRAIGVTGQVHGFVFVDAAGKALSPQFTWQDRRCADEPGFLGALRERTGHRLSTGFAPATMAWLLAHGGFPSEAVAACNICDLMVQRLCVLPRPVTDETQAASWGLFDLSQLRWDEVAIAATEIPRHFFPQMLPSGSLAGHLASAVARKLGLQPNLPVAVGIGDNQASIIAALTKPEQQILLTIGTGGQLSAVLPPNIVVNRKHPPASFELRPHINGQLAAVAASLCGGSAWKWLADLLASWANDLKMAPLSTKEIYSLLNSLGADAVDSLPEDGADDLIVTPNFLGERHDPSLRGRIDGIHPGNMWLGRMSWALAKGIVRNLREMLPMWVLEHRTTVVGTGNALRRNPLLRAAAERVFGLPLVLPEEHEEAAVGAAIMASQLISDSQSDGPRMIRRGTLKSPVPS